MKIMIEVCGGVVCNIVATDKCKIYLIDHDNIKERGEDSGKINGRLPFQTPDCITGELDTDDNDESPEFDKLLDEALEGYE